MTATKRTNLVLSLLLISIVLPVATGCSTNPVTGKRELIAIPRSYEISMGLQAAPEVEKQFGGPVADATLQAYIQMVGKKVADVADRKMPYDFTLLNSEIPNAFALPGGKIFVTAGLMSRMTNERQLAAVLGHEIVHVAALHGVKGMQRGIGASVVVELAAAAAGEDKARERLEVLSPGVHRRLQSLDVVGRRNGHASLDDLWWRRQVGTEIEELLLDPEEVRPHRLE